MSTVNETPKTADVVDEVALEVLRNPGVSTSIDQLSSLRDRGIEIIEARAAILETARSRAIRMTHPEDWVLFKSPDDRVTGYLQDSGCERVRDILSISIFDVSDPRRVVSPTDPNAFAYVITGCGRSGITQASIEAVEGVRESTEDFCKALTGVKQDIRVRQAARANLDGKIVRELAGLANVPYEELQRAWAGTDKKAEHCRKGRGFGTKQEREGGENVDIAKATEGLVPPTCPHCGATAVVKTSARGPFYACPSWKKHEDKRWALDIEKWKSDPRSKPAGASAQAPAASASGGGPTSPASQEAKPEPRTASEEPPPITDDDIPFESNRGRRR